MDNPETKKVTVPATMEGIAIHIGYMNKHLESLDTKMSEIAGNAVTRDEWIANVKAHDDHEARIRKIEAVCDDFTTVKKIVYGGVSLILVAVFSAVIYLVVQK